MTEYETGGRVEEREEKQKEEKGLRQSHQAWIICEPQKTTARTVYTDFTDPHLKLENVTFNIVLKLSCKIYNGSRSLNMKLCIAQ